MFSVDCPGCKREIDIEDHEVGAPVKCGNCGAVFKPVRPTLDAHPVNRSSLPPMQSVRPGGRYYPREPWYYSVLAACAVAIMALAFFGFAVWGIIWMSAAVDLAQARQSTAAAMALFFGISLMLGGLFGAVMTGTATLVLVDIGRRLRSIDRAMQDK